MPPSGHLHEDGSDSPMLCLYRTITLRKRNLTQAMHGACDNYLTMLNQIIKLGKLST